MASSNASVWDADLPPRLPTGKHRPKVGDRERAEIRLTVYTRDGYACVNCGWKPDVPENYRGWSALCGPAPKPGPGEGRPPSRRLAPMRVLELDHIKPYSRGGGFTVKNLQSMCSTCNSRKGARG